MFFSLDFTSLLSCFVGKQPRTTPKTLSLYPSLLRASPPTRRIFRVLPVLGSNWIMSWKNLRSLRMDHSGSKGRADWGTLLFKARAPECHQKPCLWHPKAATKTNVWGRKPVFFMALWAPWKAPPNGCSSFLWP